jgi:hypothetical protein
VAGARVEVLRLDASSGDSIAAFAAEVGARFPGQIDLLVGARAAPIVQMIAVCTCPRTCVVGFVVRVVWGRDRGCCAGRPHAKVEQPVAPGCSVSGSVNRVRRYFARLASILMLFGRAA